MGWSLIPISLTVGKMGRKTDQMRPGRAARAQISLGLKEEQSGLLKVIIPKG